MKNRTYGARPATAPGTQVTRPTSDGTRAPAMDKTVAPADPFAELADEWSRPWKIGRVLKALGMDVPDRMHRTRVAALVARLNEKQIQVTLADGSPLESSPPSIEAKLRLRRSPRVVSSEDEGLHQAGGSRAARSESRKARDADPLCPPDNPTAPRERAAQIDPGNSDDDPRDSAQRSPTLG